MKYRQPMTAMQAGFTVVETMIVLAIAGLILLVILLAIPQLERTSRNNQRTQDVQAILQAVSHWELNNSGNIPAPEVQSHFLEAAKANLVYYDTSNVIVANNGNQAEWDPTGSGYPDPVTDLNKVYIYNYQKCGTNASGQSTATGAGYSSVVALYTLETARGTTSKCQQL